MVASAWVSVAHKDQKCLVIVETTLFFISLIVAFLCAIEYLSFDGQSSDEESSDGQPANNPIVTNNSIQILHVDAQNLKFLGEGLVV